MKKKIYSILSILLIVSFLFSDILSIKVNAEENAANSRTSAMFEYFRNDRTTLSTDSVAADELKVFGVFLSNFMLQGKTTLSEFFSADSELTKQVSSIFFGSEKNSETIGKLTSMLGEGIVNGGGLSQLNYKDSNGAFFPLTMSSFVRLISGSDNLPDHGLYFGEQKVVDITNTNFRLALSMALAVSITCSEEYKDLNLAKLTTTDTDKITGIGRWLAMLEGDGGIYIDGLGNFWFDEKGTSNPGDFKLFIPACMQAFVFDPSTALDSCSVRIPLINSFVMGSLLNLNASAFNNDVFGNLNSFIDVLDKVHTVSSNRKYNAITMTVVEKAYQNGLFTAMKEMEEEELVEKLANLVNGAEVQNMDPEKAYLFIDATWSYFFTNYDHETDDMNKSEITYFSTLFELAAKNERCGVSVEEDNVSNFVTSLAFTRIVPLGNCITNMYYFNLSGTNTVSNATASTEDSNWKTASLTNNLIYQETLFTAGANSTMGGYNTISNSDMKNLLIEINDILLLNNGKYGVIKDDKAKGVDWSYAAYNDALWYVKRPNLSIPCCIIENNIHVHDGYLTATAITDKPVKDICDKLDNIITVKIEENEDTGNFEIEESIEEGEDKDDVCEEIYEKYIKNTPNYSYTGGYTSVAGVLDYYFEITDAEKEKVTLWFKPQGFQVAQDFQIKSYLTDDENSEKDCCIFHKILFTYYNHTKSIWGNSFKTFKNKMAGMTGYAMACYLVTGTPVLTQDASSISEGLAFLIACFNGNLTEEEADIIYELDHGNNNDLKKVIKNINYISGNDKDIANIMFNLNDADYKLDNSYKNIVRLFVNGSNTPKNDAVFKTFDFKNSDNVVIHTHDNKIVALSRSFSDLGTLTGRNITNILFWGIPNLTASKSNGTYLSENWIFEISGDTRGKFEGNPKSDDSDLAEFVVGLDLALVDNYIFRVASMRNNVYNALTTSIKNSGQFVANQCNVWPSIYWSYLSEMLDARVEIDDKGNRSLEFSDYSNSCLPQMLLATTGTGLSLWNGYSEDAGADAIEDMSIEEKQEDLLNKSLLLLSTTNSEYRDNWFKSMIDSWVISAHKSIIGTYTNSDLSFNMGVETGSTTYASVTGYINTPQLTDLEITAIVINKYGILYVVMMLIAVIYCFALVITGAKELKEGIIILCILGVVLVFPQVLLDNTITMVNSVVDNIYSDRFNFWAIVKHQSSLNALSAAASSSTADYIVVSNIEMAKQVYSTDQGVRVKWASPKKISNFDSLFSDAIENSKSSVNLSIFKTLFNSFFNQEQYVYDEMELYLYRPYNAVANEATQYYAIMKNIKRDEVQIKHALSSIKDTIEIETGIEPNNIEYYNVNTLDNITYSDIIQDDIYAKVDSHVALSAMQNADINDLFNFFEAGGVIIDDEYDVGDFGIKSTTDLTDDSLKLYLAYSESEFYYFYNVLKSQWSNLEEPEKRLKDMMLEPNTFEKSEVENGITYIRDFLGLEYLFEYVIPYLNEGNEYVQEYINRYGMDISNYDFSNMEADNINALGEEATEAEIAKNKEYNTEKAKKQVYGQVWMLYSSWVDQLFAANDFEKVHNSATFNPIMAANYNMYLGRDMVFSKLDMLGEYNSDIDKYVNRLDYSDLTSVEQDLLKVLEDTYEDIMYLNNYWNYDEEVILTAAAMMATFNFNRTFSNYSLLGESNILYPQDFELQNFNYDAFLRLIIMNSTGESLIDTTDLYTRVIGKTSIFTGLLLLLVDLTAVVVIPTMKLLILLLILLLGVCVCLTCVSIELKQVPKKIWVCLLKPIVFFAVFTIVFSWVISLLVGTGLTSYVGTSSASIVTNDPTITFLLVLLINIIYIVGLGYIFVMLFKTFKTEIKGFALAVTGAVAGAATVVGGKLIEKAKGAKGSGTVSGTGKGVTSTESGVGNNTDKKGKKSGSEIDDKLDGTSRHKKSGSLLNDDLRNNEDSSKDSGNKGSNEKEGTQSTSSKETEEPQSRSKNKSTIMNDMKVEEDQASASISGKGKEKKEVKPKDNKKQNKTTDNGAAKPRSLKELGKATADKNAAGVPKAHKESIGSRVATAYMTVGQKVQEGTLAARQAFNTAKQGMRKVGASIQRTGKALVDGDTYKTIGRKVAMGTVNAGIATRDAVVDGAKATRDAVVGGAKATKDAVVGGAKAVGRKVVDVKDKAVEYGEKAVTAVKDTVQDTREQMGVAGDLLSENWSDKKEKQDSAFIEADLMTAVEIANKNQTRTQMIKDTEDEWEAFKAKHKKSSKKESKADEKKTEDKKAVDIKTDGIKTGDKKAADIKAEFKKSNDRKNI